MTRGSFGNLSYSWFRTASRNDSTKPPSGVSPRGTSHRPSHADGPKRTILARDGSRRRTRRRRRLIVLLLASQGWSALGHPLAPERKASGEPQVISSHQLRRLLPLSSPRARGRIAPRWPHDLLRHSSRITPRRASHLPSPRTAGSRWLQPAGTLVARAARRSGKFPGQRRAGIRPGQELRADLPVGWPLAAGHVGHEARRACIAPKRISTDRHPRSRHQHRRAPAPPGRRHRPADNRPQHDAP